MPSLRLSVDLAIPNLDSNPTYNIFEATTDLPVRVIYTQVPTVLYVATVLIYTILYLIIATESLLFVLWNISINDNDSFGVI